MTAPAVGGIEQAFFDDVFYTPEQRIRQSLDLYRPATDGPAPLAVVIHGGSWISGSNQSSTVQAAVSRLNDRGVAAAAINYRYLSPFGGIGFDDLINDVFDAMQFLRDQADTFRIDAGRLATVGFSAGAHLGLFPASLDRFPASGTATPHPSMRASLNVYGPTDLAHAFYLGSAANAPVTYVDQETVPVFTLHGTADVVVDPDNAVSLDAALGSAGVFSDLRLIEGMGHSLDLSDAAIRQAFEDGIDFIADRLGPPRLPGDANGDGSVNLSDFLVLRRNFGSSGGFDDGDFNGDGTVNLSDFLILRRNFGGPPDAGMNAFAAAVPEPAGLLSVGLLGLLLTRRR
jgi:acetyl esterase/lipase